MAESTFTHNDHLLDKEHVREVCKIGQGASCCAFLTAGMSGLECGKGTSVEALLRERRPTMTAQGDNCAGPPDFQAVAS